MDENKLNKIIQNIVIFEQRAMFSIKKKFNIVQRPFYLQTKGDMLIWERYQLVLSMHIALMAKQAFLSLYSFSDKVFGVNRWASRKAFVHNFK